MSCYSRVTVADLEEGLATAARWHEAGAVARLRGDSRGWYVEVEW